MLTLKQFKEYIHFIKDASIEEEIVESFNENDQICDMTENEESMTSFKVDFDKIKYFIFESNLFDFKNDEKISPSTHLIFVKLGEAEDIVFGIVYKISEVLEEKILKGEKCLEQEYFNLMFPKKFLNRMLEFH